MLYQDAINNRCSRRTYLPKLVDYGCINKLRSLADEYNHKAGLNIQLAIDNGEAFKGLMKSYGMFKWVKNYIGLIENKNDICSQEKLGYYGELIVLQITEMRFAHAGSAVLLTGKAVLLNSLSMRELPVLSHSATFPVSEV